MDIGEISRVPPASLTEAPTAPLAAAPRPGSGDGAQAPATAYQQCDQCGAPVDAHQRYCVTCGAHRRHVNDPAARYLSQATARSRTSRAGSGTRQTRPPGRTRGLGTALVLAVIPVAAAVGVMVGRSSNNNDAQLIQELARRQAAVVATSSASPAATTPAAVPTATRTHSQGGRHAKNAHASGKSASSTGTAGRIISTTQYGSASQIAGATPTKAQVQQGAQATQQVQKSTGKSYVNQQSSLPGTVVVP